MIDDKTMAALWVTGAGGDAAVTDPIVLRQTGSSRLVFRATITQNKVNAEQPVKGEFYYLKKSATDEWESDLDTSKKINSLSPGTGLKVALNSEETHDVVRYCVSLRQFFQKEGIPSRGVRLPLTLIEDYGSIRYELSQLMEAVRKGSGDDALAQVLTLAAKSPDIAQIIPHLVRLKATELSKINTIAGLSTLKKAVEMWDTNTTNADEEFWQVTLAEHSFLFSQVFSAPIVLLKGKAYVGGKAFDNKGGKVVDYLFKTAATGNALIVELKTPMTKLLDSEYRTDVFPPSFDLAGSVAQVTRYKSVLMNEYLSLQGKTPEAQFNALNPLCLVVIGNISSMKSAEEKESFDLYRNGLKECSVITFDELFQKTKLLIELLEGSQDEAVVAPEKPNDEVPF